MDLFLRLDRDNKVRLYALYGRHEILQATFVNMEMARRMFPFVRAEVML